MRSLLFESAADVAMTTLEHDQTRRVLLERIDAALKALEANPGDARCRRQPYPNGMWDMVVRTQLDEWLVVWRYGPAEHEVTIIYIGPKP